jgi:hypothetical protein
MWSDGHSAVLGVEVGYSWVGSIQVDRHSMEVMGTLVDSGLSHF